jgi:hypothetical protein
MQAVQSADSRFPSKLLARWWLGRYTATDGIFYNLCNELLIHMSEQVPDDQKCENMPIKFSILVKMELNS